MQNPVLDFLGTALIPILGADVAAGTAGHIHFTLVGIAALGTLPNQLAVIFGNFDLAVEAAALAVVALGVQFGVNDVLIHILHQLQHRVNVILHIGHFHIGNGAAGRKVLELGLELQLGKGVDLLGNMDMIGIGDVILISDAGDDAKPLLQALGELI